MLRQVLDSDLKEKAGLAWTSIDRFRAIHGRTGQVYSAV
jgi:hypothetical protein